MSELISIARCPALNECLSDPFTAHPCRRVVDSQRGFPDLADARSHQLPEPWVGRLREAKLLFVSSNPSIDPTEAYPTAGWPDSAIETFFEDRFQSGAIRDGTHHRTAGGTYERSRYWTEIRNRARELYGRDDVEPGRDFALTEVVHCKSKRQYGAPEALDECISRHLGGVLSIAAARVIVCNARLAVDAIEKQFGIVLATGLTGPVDVAGRPRLLLRMPGPGSSGVRRIDRLLNAGELAMVRRWLL